MTHVGELAAAATSVCWAISATAFGAASHRVGSLPVNVWRLVMAVGLLLALTLVTRGHALPTDASTEAWWWLSASGLVGLCLGDLCSFRAFVLIGVRLTMLMMSLVPLVTTLFSFVWLDEHLTARQWLGMSLTVGGIAWAMTERGDPRLAQTPKARTLGLLFAFGGVLGQAGGLVLSKHGMGAYDPFAATQIRIFAGLAGYVVLISWLHAWPEVRRGLRDRRAVFQTSVGAFFGPFLGISLSLLAVQRCPAGVASSIIATTPLVLLPFAFATGHDRPGIAGVLGTLVSVLGVALLFT